MSHSHSNEPASTQAPTSKVEPEGLRFDVYRGSFEQDAQNLVRDVRVHIINVSTAAESILDAWWAVVPGSEQRITWQARARASHGSTARVVASDAAGEVVWSAEAHAEVMQVRTQKDLPATRATQVFTYPNWGGNPYLNMLRPEPIARGFTMAGSTDYADAISALTRQSAPEVFHLHWPTPVTESVATPEEAEHRTTEFLGAIDTYRERGGKFLWTVHNVLPHDASNRDAAVRLHKGLARAADAIHVLSAATAAAVADEYDLPSGSITVIPHSSYHGIYGGRLSRAEACRAIGAAENLTNVLFFGQVRPYKGLEHLIDALSEVDEAGAKFQLLLAGKPAPAVQPILDALAARKTPAVRALRFIGDDEVATWFSAADVVVLPYQNVLNSGTMHLAATFGVPCVLPATPSLTTTFGEDDWVHFFDTAAPARSIAAELEDGWYSSPEATQAALRYSRAHLPAQMSIRYADLLEALRS